jgi:hypothetical protein
MIKKVDDFYTLLKSGFELLIYDYTNPIKTKLKISNGTINHTVDKNLALRQIRLERINEIKTSHFPNLIITHYK